MQRVDNYDQARLLAIKSSQKDAASVHLAKITGLKLIRVTSWIVVMLQQCCNSTCVAGWLADLLLREGLIRSTVYSSHWCGWWPIIEHHELGGSKRKRRQATAPRSLRYYWRKKNWSIRTMTEKKIDARVTLERFAGAQWRMWPRDCQSLLNIVVWQNQVVDILLKNTALPRRFSFGLLVSSYGSRYERLGYTGY